MHIRLTDKNFDIVDLLNNDHMMVVIYNHHYLMQLMINYLYLMNEQYVIWMNSMYLMKEELIIEQDDYFDVAMFLKISISLNLYKKKLKRKFFLKKIFTFFWTKYSIKIHWIAGIKNTSKIIKCFKMT